MESEAGSLLVLVQFLPPVLYRSNEMQPLVTLLYQIPCNVVHSYVGGIFFNLVDA